MTGTNDNAIAIRNNRVSGIAVVYCGEHQGPRRRQATAVRPV